MADPTIEGLDLRRDRRRRSRGIVSADDRAGIAKDVTSRAMKIEAERSEDSERRLQRMAKFRMWTEETDWPWPGSSDMGLPDMMTDVLSLSDTLHNAVMNNRPVGNARAVKSTESRPGVRLTPSVLSGFSFCFFILNYCQQPAW